MLKAGLREQRAEILAMTQRYGGVGALPPAGQVGHALLPVVRPGRAADRRRLAVLILVLQRRGRKLPAKRFEEDVAGGRARHDPWRFDPSCRAAAMR